jgi:hypothetical protein
MPVDTATPLTGLIANLPDDIIALVLDAIAHHARWTRGHHTHVPPSRLAPGASVVSLADRSSARVAAQVGLRRRLRARSAVHRHHEPAVELLIAHGEWLRRNDFLANCAQGIRHTDHIGTSVPTADIMWDLVPWFLTWPDVHHTPGTSAVLALAAELAGVDTATPLSELFADLDDIDLA